MLVVGCHTFGRTVSLVRRFSTSAVVVSLLCSVCLQAQTRTPVPGPRPPGSSRGKPAPHWSLGLAEAIYIRQNDTLKVYAHNVFLARGPSGYINLGLRSVLSGLRLTPPETVVIDFSTSWKQPLFSSDPDLVLTADGKEYRAAIAERVPPLNLDPGRVQELITYRSEWEAVLAIARAKKATLSIGSYSTTLGPKHIRAFRDFERFFSGKLLHVE